MSIVSYASGAPDRIAGCLPCGCGESGLPGPSINLLLHPLTTMIRSLSLTLILCIAAMIAGTAEEVRENAYVLRPNDVIRVDVYEEPDLSGPVLILKTGHASFPLIGSVEVGGLSVTAAATRIRELYAKDYLVDPKVTLTVQQYATEFISVIGAVRNPGQIPMPSSGNLDLAAAMATAGGLAETADANGILLVRASGSTTTYSFSSIVNGAEGRVKLAAGDRIIVNQSAYVGKWITILGQVGRQGPVPFPVNGRLDLVSAIAVVGGLTDLANPRKITINRMGNIITVDYKEISQRGDRPLLLQPGDIITVPQRLF